MYAAIGWPDEQMVFGLIHFGGNVAEMSILRCVYVFIMELLETMSDGTETSNVHISYNVVEKCLSNSSLKMRRAKVP